MEWQAAAATAVAEVATVKEVEWQAVATAVAEVAMVEEEGVPSMALLARFLLAHGRAQSQ